MRFLADMGISPHSVAFLRSLGYDAVHLRELNLIRLADSDILAKALAEDRIVLTHDLDFGTLMAASGATLPSVVIFRLDNMRPENVNRFLQIITTQYGESLTQGALLSISERAIRLRRLPIH